MADSVQEIVVKAKPIVVEIVTRDITGTPKTLGTGFLFCMHSFTFLLRAAMASPK